MDKIIFFNPRMGMGGPPRVIANWGNYLQKNRIFKIYVVSDFKNDNFYKLHPSIVKIQLSLSQNSGTFVYIKKLRAILRNNGSAMNVFNKKIYIFYLTLLAIFKQIPKESKLIYFVHGGSKNFITEYNLFEVVLLKYLFDKFIILYNNLAEGDAYEKNLSIKEKIKYKISVNFDVVEIPNPIYKQHNKRKKKKENIILSAGRMDSNKSFDILIKAWSINANRHSDWKVYIVGEGPEEKKLSKLIETLNLKDKVLLKDKTRNMEEYYEKSKILVIPSIKESFGMVIIEAMQYCMPVVSFQTEGARLLISHGKNGVIVKNVSDVELAKAISELIKSKDLRLRMSRYAHQSIKPLYIEKLVERWKLL